MKRAFFIFLYIFFLAFPAYAEEAAIDAKVISVFSGDEFTALANDGKLMSIKLYGVGCPALNQPVGQQATQATTNAILDKQVKLIVIATDPSGSMLAVVKYNDRVLQETLLGAGMAWVDRTVCNIALCYNKWITMEGNAKARKAGLWGQQ